MESKADRIILWSTPRSLSSAFFRAMINRPRTKGFLEPFFNAYYLTTGQVSQRFDGITPIQENSTYLDTKKLCEADYPGGTNIDPKMVGYREMYDIFKYVTEELEQEAVIVEARDLQNHPEAMVRLYCDKVGIPFCTEMLNWSTRPEDLEVFQFLRPWFKDLLSETTFRPYKLKPSEKVPEEVESIITDHMPFYEKLYEHRLKLDI